jgi:hypothetical protein
VVGSVAFVPDGSVLLVDPTLRNAVACGPAFRALASDHFFAGRRGPLPNFHSYPEATAAHRGALDGGRTSGSDHGAITGVATLNLVPFSGPVDRLWEITSSTAVCRRLTGDAEVTE